MKPYTTDILDEIISEREHKALSITEEGKSEKGGSGDDSDKDDNKDDDDDQKGEGNNSIIQKIRFPWLKFTSQSQQSHHDKDKNDTQSIDELEHQCAICMESYEIGTDVTVGHSCIHMYHTRCILKWMWVSDFCPVCRKYLFDVKEFRDIAQGELERTRFHQLIHEDHPDLVAMYMENLGEGEQTDGVDNSASRDE